MQSIPDPVIVELVHLGQRVAANFGAPQDIEWAWADGKLSLLRSRPITSLFPLPEGMQPEPFKVMMAFSAVQGIFEPLTPLGQDTMKLVLSGGGRVFGYDVDFERQETFYTAAERLYIDFSPVLGNAIGRKVLPKIVTAIDPGVAQAFGTVILDPRLQPKGRGVTLDAARELLGFALPMAGRIAKAWRHPDAERLRITKLMDATVAATATRLAPTGDLWEDYARRLQALLDARDLFPAMVIPNGVAVVIAGMIPFFGILQRFAQEAARVTGQAEIAQLPLEIARSLPYNVTTEMDLGLWQTAVNLHAEPNPPTSLPRRRLPSWRRSILIGACRASPRVWWRRSWRSTASAAWARSISVVHAGANSPSRSCRCCRVICGSRTRPRRRIWFLAEAAQQGQRLPAGWQPRCARPRWGWIKAKLVRWATVRYRALAGLREAPKFFAIRMMSLMRQGLLASGADFVAAGLLAAADDLFFLQVRELQVIARAPDHPAGVPGAHCRASRPACPELRRKQQPRVLLSDGTCFFAGVRAPTVQ